MATISQSLKYEHPNNAGWLYNGWTLKVGNTLFVDDYSYFVGSMGVFVKYMILFYRCGPFH